MRIPPAYRTFAIILLGIAGAVVASAQSNPHELGLAGGNRKIAAQLVKTGLYMFSAEDGNALLRLSANGLILVDGKFRDDYYDALLARVKKISDQPVRVLIVTGDCAANVEKDAAFLRDGTRILAHKDICQRAASENPYHAESVPLIITYDRDYALRLGGVEAQLMHFGNAYTNGDTVVYFPNLKTVAVGNLFATTPLPDFLRGGSLVGWGSVLAQVLKLDFDVAVPAKGPTVSKADLETFKTKLDTLVSRATGLVKNGVTKDRLMSQLKTEDLGWQLTFTPDQIDHFYAELSQTKNGQPVMTGADAHQTLSQLSGWQEADSRQSTPTIRVTQ